MSKEDYDLMKQRLNSIDPFEQYELLKENLFGIAQNLGKITNSMIPLLKQGGKYSCQSAQFLAEKVCSANSLLDKLDSVSKNIQSTVGNIGDLANQISALKNKTTETKEELEKIVDSNSPESSTETPQIGGYIKHSKKRKTKKNYIKSKKINSKFKNEIPFIYFLK